MGGLNPYNKYRILSYYKEMLDLSYGKIPYPRMAIWYPSYICNQRCVYCMYKDYIDTETYISVDDSKRVFKQLDSVGVEGIELCGGGDAFTNPNIYDILKYGINNYSFKFGALTNGVLLTDELIRLIIEHFSYIRISLDNIDSEEYIKQRRPIAHSDSVVVLENIRKLVDLKNNLNTGCLIGVKILLTKPDEDIIRNVVDFCKKSGVDSVQFKVAEYINQERNSVFENGERLKSVVDSLQSDKLPILFSFKKTYIYTKCKMSPLQLTIDPLGDVYICCYYQHRRDSHFIGNLLKDNLIDFWGKKEHRAKIEGITSSECNVWNCRFHGYNDFYNNVFLKDKMQLQFC